MRLAIASGKGGTGKTTVAVHLSTLLARDTHIVLTDLDVEEPNSSLFLHLRECEPLRQTRMVPTFDQDACTSCGLCSEVCAFHALIQIPNQVLIFPQLCHSCHACSELCPAGALPMTPMEIGQITVGRTETFELVTGLLDVGQEQAVPLISKTIEYVEREYEEPVLKLYDAPPGTACPVIEVFNNVDHLLLVTEPTPFGLHDLSLAVDAARSVGVPLSVVINRYDGAFDGVEAYCEREAITIVSRIPDSRAAAACYSRGELMLSVPEVGQAFEQLAAFIKDLSAQKEQQA